MQGTTPTPVAAPGPVFVSLLSGKAEFGHPTFGMGDERRNTTDKRCLVRPGAKFCDADHISAPTAVDPTRPTVGGLPVPGVAMGGAGRARAVRYSGPCRHGPVMATVNPGV